MKMFYTSVAAPRFANAEQTMIDCLVVFPSISKEPLAYTSAEVDSGAEHSEEIFRRCLAGEFGTVAPFVARAELAAPAAMPKLEPLPIARRTSGHKPKPAAAPPPATKKRKRALLGPPNPPVLIKKRKPPAPAKPPKRKR